MKETKIKSLTKEQREDLIKRLWELQEHKCKICGKPIDLSIHEVDIDHIVSLDLGGLDDENNWGVVHAEHNKIKGNRDLQLMSYIFNFREHMEKYLREKKEFILGDALNEFYPERDRNNTVEFELTESQSQNQIKVSYPTGNIETYPVLADERDNSVKSFVAMVPFEYVYHDSSINPRSIIDLEPLIEEFYYKHPQLQPCLAYVKFDGIKGKSDIWVFDGQHKAAAQLYLRNEKLLVRVFINPDIDKIKLTNFRAHTIVAQVHFPQLIQDKVGYSLFKLEFEKWKEKADVERQSEEDFLRETEDKDQYRIFLQNYLKYRVLFSEGGQKNKILNYTETVTARSKKFPLVYETLNRTFFRLFLYLKPASEPIQDSEKYRTLEMKNLSNFMEIFTEEVLEKKFEVKDGAIFKIEEKIRDDPNSVPDAHLIAYRMCRAPAMTVYLTEVKKAIAWLLRSRNKYINNKWGDDRVFWCKIDDDEWRKIRRMIQVINQHKIWREKENEEVLRGLYSTKQKDWVELLIEGRLPGRTERYFSQLTSQKIYDEAIKV